ncbi:MEDS domain-containing protein [Actinokineospora inagensis]|uniref:MEDS domain-containing protein n=1 Tax=Actinokineospora inagensis TaxID=103730 RepID=UPI000400B2FB|nr:MEDS domain-containing protein [Actinokineospora inagensis]
MNPGAESNHLPATDGRGHLCWAFTDRDEFAARAREFMAEGLGEGKRVCLIAPGTVEELVGDLRDLPDFDEQWDRGAVQVRSLDGVYGAGVVVDPDEQVRVYHAETQAAVAAGFTGLRVAANTTELVRTPAQLAAFATYEHAVDRYMAAYRFEAMCAYSRPDLGSDVINRLAALHPRGNADTVPFRLHGWGGGGAVALEGELDLRSHDVFPWALGHVAGQWEPGEVVVDARELTFIDHHGLLRLAAQAERRGTTVVLRTRRFSPARMVDILGLSTVRVEQVA